MIDYDKLPGLLERATANLTVKDWGRPEYLDGAQMQYAVTNEKTWSIAYVGNLADAELFALAPELADDNIRLRARIETLEGEVEQMRVSYQDLYDDAITDAKSDAVAFEGDLWKEIRSLMDACGFDWSGDVQFDGVTASEAAEFLRAAIKGDQQ